MTTQHEAVQRAIECALRVDEALERTGVHASVDDLLELGNLWAAIAGQLPFETVAAAETEYESLVVPAPAYVPGSDDCGHCPCGSGYSPEVCVGSSTHRPSDPRETAVLDVAELMRERQRLVEQGVPSDTLLIPLESPAAPATFCHCRGGERHVFGAPGCEHGPR
jgi:hypothetical protein